MEEKKLRAAKMYFKHKVDIEKFKKETFDKLELNSEIIHKPFRTEKRKRRYSSWILAVAASVLIIGISVAYNGTHIVDAAQSFISQLFGSRENLKQAYPDESKEELDFYEQTLQIAKENLTEKEFNQYSELIKEQTKIHSKVQKEKRKYPNEEEEKRLKQIQKLLQAYEHKIIPIQAQQLASFPFTNPSYLPKGYQLVDKNYISQKPEDEPVVSSNYSDGKSFFWTKQMNLKQKDDLETPQKIENTESYSLNGYQFKFVTFDDESFNMKVGLRVTVPQKGYKIVMLAEELPKQEMEKVLISMIEE
ncbi:DUF4367 domain-containing protein [Falsibacillus pallidus]|uniref:Uncharacterized protein DUF4367 n=1 Tax=Falsibacillus pallidus TaxID=493781 RepID=A0A370GBI2_9BACI|nr:DUF4367 domain-containing protein [Falsibacillus pallidus]RDI41081.1 uncharacterized protein DUF4367 [Falsibacillus pallidus]